jgi:uncharacterized protein YxjI
MDPAPSGWTRFVMKSKFGAGRDFSVLDANDQQVFYVDGKMGTRPKADVKDAAGDVGYSIRGSLLGIPKHITISDGDGNEVGSLKAKAFSMVKDKMSLTMSDGSDWSLEGSFIEKEYTIDSHERPIVRITQKWVTARDAYTLDVADGIDVGLALAVVWAVDRWVERD